MGGGAVISEASEELRKFVDLVDAPVCDTLMGKGAFDGTDYRYTGMLGMHGTKTSNLGVSECDLLIAIGARFSDRVLGNPKKFARHAKILHIDVDPAEINKNVVADASIHSADMQNGWHTSSRCRLDTQWFTILKDLAVHISLKKFMKWYMAMRLW